jgi:hypothetical protein
MNGKETWNERSIAAALPFCWLSARYTRGIHQRPRDGSEFRMGPQSSSAI